MAEVTNNGENQSFEGDGIQLPTEMPQIPDPIYQQQQQKQQQQMPNPALIDRPMEMEIPAAKVSKFANIRHTKCHSVHLLFFFFDTY